VKRHERTLHASLVHDVTASTALLHSNRL